MDRERGPSGEFTEAVTQERVLSVFDAVDGPVITTSDVAEILGCSTETARRKLRVLERRGVVDRRKTGRTNVWWLADTRRTSPTPVDTTDPVFTDRPTFSTGRPGLSERVDELLYGRPE